MVLFSKFYNQVLNTMKSTTVAQMTDDEIMEMLDLMMIRAIAAFRFPDVDLSYEEVETEFGAEYAFKEEVTQRELNVLLTLIKVFWLEQQIDNEDQFTGGYYDRDVRTFSSANLTKVLQNRLSDAKVEVRRAQFDYSRGHGKDIRIGTINE